MELLSGKGHAWCQWFKPSIRVRDAKKLQHDGIKVEFVGSIDMHNYSTEFLLSQEFTAPGEMRQAQTYDFDFNNVEKQFESYHGINERDICVHSFVADVNKERDIWVHSFRPPPETNATIKMEVRIEDCLPIEFEYKQVKIYFLLVRIKIKHMELSIIRRETTGSPPNQYNESETITKFEIMDGSPAALVGDLSPPPECTPFPPPAVLLMLMVTDLRSTGETIPIRLFLGGFDLTPTFRDIDKKFSTRYSLGLVLIDEENRRYFKQREITIVSIPEYYDATSTLPLARLTLYFLYPPPLPTHDRLPTHLLYLPAPTLPRLPRRPLRTPTYLFCVVAMLNHLLLLSLMSDSISRLPPELERHTFEIAAHSDLKSIPTLLLVAHRVKIWLEPILYSVVIASDPLTGLLCFDPVHFSLALHSRAFSQHVTNLLCRWFPHPQLVAVLASCSAVENLMLLSNHPDLLPFLSAMPLRRLHTTLKDLFPTGVDFTHPLFLHITHLELMDSLHGGEDLWKGLAVIPNLTHLAFWTLRSIPFFRATLAACPTLRILVFRYHRARADLGKRLDSLAHDTRFVLMSAQSFIKDWQIGALGGEDFWVRAERFIAQRNSGEIDRAGYCINEERVGFELAPLVVRFAMDFDHVQMQSRIGAVAAKDFYPGTVSIGKLTQSQGRVFGPP
ncbi:vacuolar protein sorting-associated protein 26-domain-containing protein [Mycena galopus ATCC 62051]|nr:vacuolar protein sorting-associated protein 26-domain-containing protein [Mycena galopus ATCC 62051]